MNVKATYESKSDFMRQVSKQTLIRIIFPAIFFALTFIMFIVAALTIFKRNVNQHYFFLYLSAIFFIFCFLYTVKIIKGEKVYTTKRGKFEKYHYICKSEYLDIVNSYNS